MHTFHARCAYHCAELKWQSLSSKRRARQILPWLISIRCLGTASRRTPKFYPIEEQPTVPRCDRLGSSSLPRLHHVYGEEVRAALVMAWASDRICGKRLQPLL